MSSAFRKGALNITKPVMSVLRGIQMLDTCSVPELAKEIRRPKNTVYVITKRLKQAGFIVSIGRPNYKLAYKGEVLLLAMEGLLL